MCIVSYYIHNLIFKKPKKWREKVKALLPIRSWAIFFVRVRVDCMSLKVALMSSSPFDTTSWIKQSIDLPVLLFLKKNYFSSPTRKSQFSKLTLSISCSFFSLWPTCLTCSSMIGSQHQENKPNPPSQSIKSCSAIHLLFYVCSFIFFTINIDVCICKSSTWPYS